MKRVVAGFLIAPIIPFLPYTLIGLFLPVMFIGFVPAYGSAFFLGIPLHYLLKKYPHLQTGSYYSLFAGIIGLIGGIVLGTLVSSTSANGESDLLIGCFISGIYGFLHGLFSGIAFWVIARPKIHPDLLMKEESSNA